MKIIGNKKGQGTLEYIMISALIGVACLTVFSKFGKTLEEKVQMMNSKINKVLDMRKI